MPARRKANGPPAQRRRAGRAEQINGSAGVRLDQAQASSSGHGGDQEERVDVSEAPDSSDGGERVGEVARGWRLDEGEMRGVLMRPTRGKA